VRSEAAESSALVRAFFLSTMRRCALLFPLLFAISCTTTPAAAAAEETTAIQGAAVEGDTLDIRGRIDGTRASFALRTGSGCARDVNLPAITSGSAFTVALDEANLETALGCVVDVEVDGELGDPIAVSPGGAVLTSSPSLSLDAFALVSADLDPRAGDAVRVTVLSADAAKRGALTLGSRQFTATIARDDDESRVLFEIPARVWAHAVLERATLHVDVTTSAGMRSMDLRPTARVESLSSSGGGEG
jgi:hypothetical protein